MATYEELSYFDEDFTPQQNANFRPGLDSVADGVYDWTILAANLDRTPNSNDLILRVELRVEQTAAIVEHVYFFREQKNADQLGGDLSILGFPVATWTPAHGKRFSDELPKAIAQLPGIRFKGQKKASPKKDDPTKFWQNLYITARLANAPGVRSATRPSAAPAAPPPSAQPSARPQGAASAPPAQPEPEPAGVGTNTADIPF